MYFRCKKLADLEKVFGPVARIVNQQVKELTGSSQRCIKSISVSTEVRPFWSANDTYCGHRGVIDLATGMILGSEHVLVGESAINNRRDLTGKINPEPGRALFDLTWSDYYGVMSMDLTVHPDNMPKLLED